MDNSTFNSTFDANGTNGTNGTAHGFNADGTPKSFWTNLLLPTLYLTILVGSLYTFSSLYRKRQVSKAAKLEPWFPAHRQRDIYLSLLHIDPSESSGGADEKKLSKVPDSILKAALLSRALEDIRRIVQLRMAKPALQNLLQRGSVGEDLWQRFLRAEKEIEEEIKDVVSEANAYVQGWGQVIFQSANEMNQNDLIKKKMDEIFSQVDDERAWWETKRAHIQSQFLKEEGVESPATPEHKKSGSSDDDAVLVDVDSPAVSQGSAQKKKGSSKK